MGWRPCPIAMPAPAPFPGYPAPDPGFPAVPVAELLASADDLQSRIRLCFGIARETFDRDVQPLLQCYAAFTHLLPATADNHFSAPGGLLRLGLEVAFYSLQGTDAHIFAGRMTISARRELEPRWRLATFIGGLCCELHRVLGHLVVTDETGAEWPAFLVPLADWLTARQARHYHVRWRPNAPTARGIGLYALPHVVPPATMQYLADHNTVVVPHLLASIGGAPLYREPNVLDSLVRRSLALVIDRHLQSHADRHGAPRHGSHLERDLVDAMRRLVATRASWAPNAERSRVWWGRDGLFVVWPQAAHDIRGLLEDDQLAGIPKAPETILELLLEAGVIEQPDGNATTWQVHPPAAKAPLEAVKLASPAILLSDLDGAFQPLDVALRRAPAHAAVPPEPPTRTPAPPGPQLPLLDPPAAPPNGAGHPPTGASPDAPSGRPAAPPKFATSEPFMTAGPPEPRPYRLIAPMRLNPAVRDALAAIVDTLNGPPGDAAAVAVPTGLFVPLDALQHRGIEPALAVRALREAGLLASPRAGGPATVSFDVRGAPTAGLVIAPGCIDGFDPEAFIDDPEQ